MTKRQAPLKELAFLKKEVNCMKNNGITCLVQKNIQLKNIF